ncbi:hypothetical protein V6N13_120066 [Hibiscus sabdariffa]
MCWLLWKRRCRLLLEEDVGVLDDVLVTGNCLLMQTKDAFTMLVGSNARNAVARTWCRPQPGAAGTRVRGWFECVLSPAGRYDSVSYLGAGCIGCCSWYACTGCTGTAPDAPVISGAAVGIG